MRTHDRSRFLAWLLLVAMVLTMLPTAAFCRGCLQPMPRWISLRQKTLRLGSI